MATQGELKRIREAISVAKQDQAFCTSGTIESEGSPLSVVGVGPLSFPLSRAQLTKLRKLAAPAPYGKGTKTLIDKAVRSTLELQPDQIELTAPFQAAIDRAGDQLAEDLGLPRERLRLELYKLLIYQRGGFFLPHRDSEKRAGMVASLIVILPSPFAGGELVIVQGSTRETFAFSEAAAGRATEFVAFFADCQHEVLKVASGLRVGLAFNLILAPERRAASDHGDCDPEVLRTIRSWLRDRGEEPLVFALEHQYTEAGLTPSLLKGADRVVYEQLAAAAKTVHCQLHFGQVSRHLCQYADDDATDYRSRRNRRYGVEPSSIDYEDLYLGEIYEDETVIDGWKNADGKAVNFGALNCDSDLIVSTLPLEEWIPTRQDYEGYTGNAGNTLDRWYHKSAVVLWPAQHHFEVLARIGSASAVTTLIEMRRQLATTPDSELEQACDDCQQLAEAIIRHWPDRSDGYPWYVEKTPDWIPLFLAELPTFDDSDLIDQLLQKLADCDRLTDLTGLVTESLKRMGAEDVLPVLRSYLSTLPLAIGYDGVPPQELPERDGKWLVKLAERHEALDVSASDLQDLLSVAVDRHLKAIAEAIPNPRSHDKGLTSAWFQLCQATLMLPADRLAKRLFECPAKYPKHFDLREYQVEAALKLHKWAAKRLHKIPALLTGWLMEIRQELERRTSTKPARPTDFSRDGWQACNCKNCQPLMSFLSNPSAETTRISGNESVREHLQQIVDRHDLDVKSKLDRSTRPFALIFTKTTAGYERQLATYEADRKRLQSIHSIL